MSKTLRQLLEEGKSFKYGTDYNKVEAETQSLSDFEANGLRPNFGNLGTNLYGTETLRITKQSTALVDDMRAATGGNQGLLGGLLNQGTKLVNNFASTLGIPVLQIPTRVSDDNGLSLAIKKGDNIMVELAKIRKKQEGNILGKFLKQTAEGTPSQVGRRAIGSARNIAKNAAKNLLFGNGEGGINEVSKNTLSLSGESITYGSDYRKRYSYQVRRSGDSELGIYTLLNDIQDGESGIDEFVLFKGIQDLTQKPNPQNTDVFPEFPQFSVDSITQNIPGKRDKTNKYTDVGNFNTNLPYILETKDGSDGKFRTKSDTINLSDLYTDENDTSLDDYDFIPLRFYSVAKQQGVAFKATVNGLSENFSPTWEGSNFIGNPYPFYTFSGVDRDLTFSFSVYALNSQELIKCWEKLDFLTSFVYPQNQNPFQVYTIAPLSKITIGNMYKNKLGFIESLSYTIDDNTPWEIGLDVEKDNNNRITSIKNNGTMKNYKLPTIVNVAVSYQILETAKDVAGKKLYPYG